MKKSKWILLFVVVFLIGGCSEARQGGGDVLARFDGQTIRTQEFIKKAQTLPRELQRVVWSRKKEFLDEIINERYLAREAKKRRLDDQPDVQELLEAAKDKILVAKLIALEVDSKVSLSPDEAVTYYDAHKDQFMTPLLYRGGHILVKTQEEADSIKAELNSGADFEEIARTKSIDNTALRGGDLGFFQKGQLAPEFETVIIGLKKGEVSSVFKTSFGYHVAKLTDKAEPSLRPFAVVRPVVERQLLNQKRADIFKTYLEKVKGKAKVQVNDKALEALTPPADQPAVQPVPAPEKAEEEPAGAQAQPDSP